MSLVEVLLAAAILGCALMATYGSLSDSLHLVSRVDRRAQAEAISLNIHERHFHTEAPVLLAKFGGDDGGVEALRDDPVITGALPESWDALKAAGVTVRAQAISLSRGAGDRAVHFSTEVSYLGIDGRRRVVSHARVLASGLALDTLPGKLAEAAAPGRTYENAPQPELLPLTALDEPGDRFRAAKVALAGQGAFAPVVFRGSLATTEHLRDAVRRRPAPVAGGATGGSAAATSSSAAAPAAHSGRAACLPPADDPRAVLRQWAGLENDRVPPGDYRVDGKRYDQPIGPKVMHLEVLRLQPLAGALPEARWFLARHTSGPAGVEDDRIEGKPVLERRTVSVRAAGPDMPPAPGGLTAVVERTADRLYVNRPSFVADGSPALFGRDLAVIALGAEEPGAAAGPAGQAAFAAISARWCLSTGRAPAPAADEEVAFSDADWESPPPGPPAHMETGDITLAQAPTVANVAVEVIREAPLEPAADPITARKLEALAHMKEGRVAEAAAIYSELDAAGSADAATLANMAAVAIEQRDYEAAERAAARALAQNPDHPNALLNLALSYELRGRAAEAREAYARGLARQPDSPGLKAGLARVKS